jgi:hypothetical protein
MKKLLLDNELNEGLKKLIEADMQLYDKPLEETAAPYFILEYRKIHNGKRLKNIVDQYYEFMQAIEEKYKNNDISEMLLNCQLSYSCIEPLIELTKLEWGVFDIKEIPAIEKGLRFLPIISAKGQLQNLVDFINYFPELEMYRDQIEGAFGRLDIVQKINKELALTTEGYKQTELAKKINVDGRTLSFITYDMEKAKLIEKENIKNRVILKPKANIHS